MKRSLTYLVAALLVVGMAQTVTAAGLTGDRPFKTFELAQEPFDRAEHFQRMTALQGRLSRAMVVGGEPLVVAVSAAERRSIVEDRTFEQKMRVGIVKELAVSMGFGRE